VSREDQERTEEKWGQLGDCPCCGTPIAEGKTHVERFEIEESPGGFRQWVPGAVELTLKPCGCRFEGGAAAELGAQLHARQRGEQQ
jgi:hypothetical protein